MCNRPAYWLVCWLLLVTVNCKSTQPIPADTQAFEAQTNNTIEAVEQNKNLTPQEKKEIITNLKSGVAMTKQSQQQAQQQANINADLQKKLDKVEVKAARYEGIEYAIAAIVVLLALGGGIVWYLRR